jgi:uncharacterized Zn finger protein
MTPLPFTEAVIRQHTTPESFRRGQEYVRQGLVTAIARRDNSIEAEVFGSAPDPYEVRVHFDAGGISVATCTCPVEVGWCKHIVATLLTYLSEPDAVEERPSLKAAIDELDRDQMREILVALADRDPSLSRTIEVEIALLSPAGSGSNESSKPEVRPRLVPVDTKALRREVRGALHSLDRMRASDAYWQVGSVIGEVRGFLDRAWAFTHAGDGRTAMTMLEAITDEYVKEWMNLDGSDGDTGDFFSVIGDAWTEAVLSADLSEDERGTWTARLEEWQDEIVDYGIDDAFGAAIDALELGWDDPDLQAVLAGELVVEDAWYGWNEEIHAGLTVARLNVLERQGRNEEYLRLAGAAGLTWLYAAALVRMGRIDEATEYGLARFRTAGQALALAQRLREQQAVSSALTVAEHGMSLDGPKTQLAIWLRDMAGGLGRSDLALSAAETAFQEDRSLSSFLAIKELAGDQWLQRREPLLDQLRGVRGYSRVGVAEVFIHEGLIDDAIATVDGSTDYYAIEPVVKAAVATRPDWAIGAAKDQAESIMDASQAQYYHHAVRWLGHARDAYLAAGRRAEWQAYVDGLIKHHGRKHKLVPMLKGLGR